MPSPENSAYIYDHVRSPRGKGKKDGSLHQITALDLSKQVLEAVKDRNSLDTSLVDDVMWGCVTPVGEQGGDIARAAGLSTGALFANFADKNEIFLTVLESENTRVIRTMRDALDEKLDLVSRLHTQLMRGYEATQHNARIVLSAFVMKWSQGQTPVNQVGQMSDLIRFVLLDTLKAAQARNEVPQSVNVECAAEVLEDLCLANLRRAYQGSDDSGAFDMERLAKSLNAQIALVVAGLKAA